MKPDVPVRIVRTLPPVLPSPVWEPGTLYVYQDEEYGDVGILQCPCGCRRKSSVYFDADKHPPGAGLWTLTGTDDAPTLYPSLNSKGLPCKSHFFITDGVARWV